MNQTVKKFRFTFQIISEKSSNLCKQNLQIVFKPKYLISSIFQPLKTYAISSRIHLRIAKMQIIAGDQ